MKVLMFGWEFPPHISGGLGTACYGLTKGLAANNVDVMFVMPSASGDENQESVRIINASDVELTDSLKNLQKFVERVSFIKIDSTLLPYLNPEEFARMYSEDRAGHNEWFRTHYGQKYKFSGKYGLNLLEEVARYGLVGGEVAGRYQFDVIHAHDWMTYFAGINAAKISGKPLVIHVHATEYDRSGQNINTQVFDIEREGMLAADRIIAVSNLTRNTIISKYGIDPAKVVTVHNAVDFENFEKMEVERSVKEKVVTFLGRITFQKGPEYFIEAAAKVLERYPDVRFVMAGSGDMLNKSIRRVARLGIATKFHFTGFLKGDDVKKMFAYSDVYVMPSVSEPFGISPLEAMRSNVPAIISRQSGVAEVLNHAIKVDFWDIDAMADAIYSLLKYPALSNMAVRCGMDEVNELRWEEAAAHVKSVYEEVTR
jgi:glycosyltransferase involved in cell wall biosynthesis